MLRHKDFIPKMISAPGLLTRAEFETFADAVEAAGRWIAENEIHVLNVETVVLPNIWESYGQGSSGPPLHATGDLGTTWHQFVRCWYDDLNDEPYFENEVH